MVFHYKIGDNFNDTIKAVMPPISEGVKVVKIQDYRKSDPIIRKVQQNKNGLYFTYNSNRVYLVDYERMSVNEAHTRILHSFDNSINNLLLAIISAGADNVELVDISLDRRFHVDLYETIKMEDGRVVFTKEIIKDGVMIQGPTFPSHSLYSLIQDGQIEPTLVRGVDKDYTDDFWSH